MSVRSLLLCGGPHQVLGDTPLWKTRQIIVAIVWACLTDLAVSSFLKRQDPKAAMQNFVDNKIGESYMDAWKKQGWESASHGCGADKLPVATKMIIQKTCGDDTDKDDRCICIVAKAHSCHVGCTNKLKKNKAKVLEKGSCPSSCISPSFGGQCGPGDRINGGVALSEGDGKCYKYCSKKAGRYRFCGVGPSYQSGSFVDCTGCDPSTADAKKRLRQTMGAASVKKLEWTECMADCYPTPSCMEMCAEGSKECYNQCVERYTAAVEPYWDVFRNSSTLVSDYAPLSKTALSHYLSA